jgi:ABC-type branched-subunit amino acid transport system ATPase component
MRRERRNGARIDWIREPRTGCCWMNYPAGLAPVLVDAIFDIIQELYSKATTILLVEQNARLALQVADRGYILQTGAIVLRRQRRTVTRE